MLAAPKDVSGVGLVRLLLLYSCCCAKEEPMFRKGLEWINTKKPVAVKGSPGHIPVAVHTAVFAKFFACWQTYRKKIKALMIQQCGWVCEVAVVAVKVAGNAVIWKMLQAPDPRPGESNWGSFFSKARCLSGMQFCSLKYVALVVLLR